MIFFSLRTQIMMTPRIRHVVLVGLLLHTFASHVEGRTLRCYYHGSRYWEVYDYCVASCSVPYKRLQKYDYRCRGSKICCLYNPVSLGWSWYLGTYARLCSSKVICSTQLRSFVFWNGFYRILVHYTPLGSHDSFCFVRIQGNRSIQVSPTFSSGEF